MAGWGVGVATRLAEGAGAGDGVTVTVGAASGADGTAVGVPEHAAVARANPSVTTSALGPRNPFGRGRWTPFVPGGRDGDVRSWEVSLADGRLGSITILPNGAR